MLAGHSLNSEVDFASEMQNSYSLNKTPTSQNLVHLSDYIFSLRALFIPAPLSPDANLSDDPQLGCAPPFLLFTFTCSLYLRSLRVSPS